VMGYCTLTAPWERSQRYSFGDHLLDGGSRL
jgi:hypothetical protein